MKKILTVLIVMLSLVVIGYVFFSYYPYIFAKTVIGEVTNVERVSTPLALFTQNAVPPTQQIFSFAVAVKDEKTGEIITASAEDRQWAAVQKGYCAKVKFFPYPPWKLDKAGTYYGARLLHLYECKK
jgi:hypothetical protein